MKRALIRSPKISQRLTLIFALLFFGALFSVNAVTLFSINYYINDQAKQQLYLFSDAIKTEVITLEAIPTIDFQKYSKIAENVDINFLYNNKSIYNSGEINSSKNIDSSLIDHIQSSENVEGRIIYLNTQYYLEDGSRLTISLVKDMDNSDNYIRDVSGIILIINVIMFLLAIVVGYYISRKALSPIDQITEQAQKISATDLSARIQTDGPDDELKRLANTFNDLIERIEEVYKRQNRFTLDASHELATPIAVIKGYTDILDRWGKTNPEVLDESITSIKTELENIKHLIDTLLYLSKGDNNIFPLKPIRFSVDDLVSILISEAELIGSNHRIRTLNNEPLEFNLDYSLIKQMLRALINNSIKYSKQESEICISYKIVESNLVFEIMDQGIGIPEEDIPYIFDRFYRVDRSRNRENGGTGLGLSLVKWIVDIHHGEIKVLSKVNKGTTFQIILPPLKLL